MKHKHIGYEQRVIEGALKIERLQMSIMSTPRDMWRRKQLRIAHSESRQRRASEQARKDRKAVLLPVEGG